jgi:hypothetical protein
MTPLPASATPAPEGADRILPTIAQDLLNRNPELMGRRLPIIISASPKPMGPDAYAPNACFLMALTPAGPHLGVMPFREDVTVPMGGIKPRGATDILTFLETLCATGPAYILIHEPPHDWNLTLCGNLLAAYEARGEATPYPEGRTQGRITLGRLPMERATPPLPRENELAQAIEAARREPDFLRVPE